MTAAAAAVAFTTMNDPGLDTSISNDAKVIESQKQSDEHDEVEEDEQAFLAPRCVRVCSPRGVLSWTDGLTLEWHSRWWFASTAFPLAAGTFGPMASAFSICALAIHWRVDVPPGTAEAFGTYVDDPPW